MANDDVMFNWMMEVASDEELELTELFDECLNEKVGRFIHYFGADNTDSTLGLKDNEIVELYPQKKCPLSYKERQEFRQTLTAHLFSCDACMQIALRQEAESIIRDRAICRYFEQMLQPETNSVFIAVN